MWTVELVREGSGAECHSDHELGREVHVVPEDDLVLHILASYCACIPELRESGKLIVHNSWDGRELYEDCKEV